MMTRLTLLRVDDSPVVHHVDLPERPTFQQLKQVIEPMLGGRIGHHYCDHEGVRVDLFDDFDAIAKMLPKNERASEIYSADVRRRHPDQPLVPVILGPAVLSDRQVWFQL